MDTTDAPQIFEHFTKALNITPFDVKWLPYSAKAVLVGQTPKMEGVIKFYKLQKDELAEIKTQTFGKGLKTCAFNYYTESTAPTLAIGDLSGKLFIYDMEKEKVSYEVQAHQVMVNTLDTVGGLIGKGAVEIVTGGRDGRVKLWDPRQTAPVLSLEPIQSDKTTVPDCWAVALGNAEGHEDRCIVSGYDNGDVKMFDLRKNELIWEENLKNGVCGLEFDRRDIKMNKLSATTLEGKVHLFDLRTLNPVSGFAGLSEKVSDSTMWGIRHSPQNRDLFVSLGGDGMLRLHKYNYPTQRKIRDEEGRDKGVMGSLELLNDRKVAQQPIVGFDWNNDKEGLGISVSLDQMVKIVLFTKLNLY